MTRSVVVVGMVMGMGVLSAACEPAPEAEVDFGGPELDAMTGKPGGQDTNGTPNAAWHEWKQELAMALMSPLMLNNTVNPAIVASGILDDDDLGDGEDSYGQMVFDHAFRCAMAPETILVHGKAYQGRGLVVGASGWINQGLPADVVANVLECVIAFVNDKTEGVSILLTGENVIPDPPEVDHSDFIHGEAVWCANAGSAGFGGVDVYVKSSFARGCGINAKAALEKRYCHELYACDLNYRGFLENHPDCEEVGTPGEGHYVCNGKPCTMTWLLDEEPDWCDPPVQ